MSSTQTIIGNGYSLSYSQNIDGSHKCNLISSSPSATADSSIKMIGIVNTNTINSNIPNEILKCSSVT